MIVLFIAFLSVSIHANRAIHIIGYEPVPQCCTNEEEVSRCSAAHSSPVRHRSGSLKYQCFLICRIYHALQSTCYRGNQVARPCFNLRNCADRKVWNCQSITDVHKQTIDDDMHLKYRLTEPRSLVLLTTLPLPHNKGTMLRAICLQVRAHRGLQELAKRVDISPH